MKKTTKAISFLLSLCMMLSVFTFTVFAEETSNSKLIASGTCGDNLQWTLDDEYTLTISGAGNMESYYYDYSSPWIDYRSVIKSVIVEYGVTSISFLAFDILNSVESVTLPNSVAFIDSNSFLFCSSLENITIPDSVKYIGNGAFQYCSSLKSISISDSVIFIDSFAFYNCKDLQSITIPDSVLFIGEKAFGYINVDNKGTKIEGFTIYGSKGSAAEKYATENEFTFIDTSKFPRSNSNEYIDVQNAIMPNVAENTTSEELISNLLRYGITATITDKDGNALESNSKVGTGCKVKDESGNVYTVIVKGDTDSTGKVDSTDYLQIKQQFLGEYTLEDLHFIASDVDKDKKSSENDYLNLKEYFLGKLNLYK